MDVLTALFRSLVSVRPRAGGFPWLGGSPPGHGRAPARGGGVAGSRWQGEGGREKVAGRRWQRGGGKDGVTRRG